MRRFQGAKSQWGEGKIHEARYDPRLSRWVAACQRLDPLKGGHDAYDGHVLGVRDEAPLSCKRCLANAEQRRWEPMIETVTTELRQRYPGRWSGWYGWAAKNAVTEWAAQYGEPATPEEISDWLNQQGVPR